MLASDFFTPARLKEMRDEIIAEGFVADKFLAVNPDSPVLGVNLACLYPFPKEIGAVYETVAHQLSELDPGVYVYPMWETHVTLATFINFTQHQFPSSQRITELNHVMQQIALQLEPGFSDVKPFELSIEQPIIGRKAAILPLSDPTDGISRIRNCVIQKLAVDPKFQTSLEGLGLNIPSIVHSTIMRFKKVPEDTQRFLSKFDNISVSVPRAVMRVKDVYITTETKPYMREGEIFRRYQL